MDFSIGSFWRLLADKLPKFFRKLFKKIFSKNKPQAGESNVERKEREKEPETILLLGTASAVLAGGVKIVTSRILEEVDGFELPSPHIDWDSIFGEGSTSTAEVQDSHWNNIFTKRETPKGAPKGFRQGEEIQVQNTDGVFSYRNAQYAGARYGNPLNIRPRMVNDEIVERQRDIWQGETGHHFSKSGAFVAFSDPYYSFRAAAHLLMAYSKPDGRNLHHIHGWIYTYCPTKDKYAKGGVQASQSYVDFVVKKVNEYGRLKSKYGIIDEYTYLDMRDKDVYMSVLKAMAYNESNCDVSWDYLSAVYEADMHGAQPPLQSYILSNRDKFRSYSQSNSSYASNRGTQSVDKNVVKTNG